MSAVRDWLKETVATVLGCNPAEVTDDSYLLGDIAADSLDLQEFVASAEDRFQITIEDAELVDIETVGQAVTLIESKVAPE